MKGDKIMNDFISLTNEQLNNKNLPYKMYETDKMRLIRIKKKMADGRMRTLRNKERGQIYTNKRALFYIKKVLEEI